ncbi:MAG: hypothetical protein AAF938_30395 [Myxococcota bacterium]
MNDAGEPVASVRVRGCYLPSGRLLHQQRRTAQGVCLFGWPAGDESLHLHIDSDAGEAQLEVAAHRANAATVIEVLLTSSLEAA